MYIQDLEGDHPAYNLMKGISCVDCGLVPQADTGLRNPHSTTQLIVDGWQTWKEIICPICLRKRKIKKIING